MPVRKIPPNYRNVTGRVSSRKAFGGAAAFESTLERDLYRRLDFNPLVERFEEQPVCIEYVADGRTRTYTPDVAIAFVDGRPPYLVEVKYEEDLREQWPALKPKIQAAAQYAKHNGQRFKLLTERKIRTPFLDNALFLGRYRDYSPSAENRRRLLDTVESLGSVTVSALLDRVSQTQEEHLALMPVAWHLVATGQVDVDLDSPVKMQSVVTYPASGRAGKWY
ncbi:MAG TPA: TnsA endonuclease N-terminal domain-containing protein [Gammaproteobacteria bacterium]|nr:TnsA endonuclease N-terminal domain-containing protein [Gammaproteobacteria bacterium]